LKENSQIFNEDFYLPLYLPLWSALENIDQSPGPDGITPSILQRLEDSVVVAPLQIIFNRASETGDSPKEGKLRASLQSSKKAPKETRVTTGQFLSQVYRARYWNLLSKTE
jgi:hypothetical protein